ncbi:ABC transporter substrate-binding protein [Speluncibacter jeojiensis]|uniref:ABC transporter substrate-binding protein n=1 Tax=Speluncibacter jeojiensis TaxID=2710754 RepID=A0A9X4M2J6_9ACTN|nr:ABC transporter substrate-binding protein [Corynebacteriales bacterium D3-21]
MSALIALVVLLGVATACGDDDAGPAHPADTIGYVVDAPVSTYNAGTVDGAASGARQALVRVLPGFSYPAPSGRALPDTDFGIAAAEPGSPRTIGYRINPAAVYSDGAPVTCDDLVLAWAAHSGRFPGFDAADRTGWSDIDSVDCRPGAKDATAHLRSDLADWRSLFGATSLMPAHVVARATGVDDIVGAVQRGDQRELGAIARFWNTGWKLAPGRVDLSLLPSAGPYRIASYGADGKLVLVANERWWGDPPRTETIAVFARGATFDERALAERTDAGQVDVVDIGAGALGDGVGAGFTSTTTPAMNTEQLILRTEGAPASAAARRALAYCVPRRDLADRILTPLYGKSGAPLDTHLQLPGTALYPRTAAVVGDRFAVPDIGAARSAVADAGVGALTVRIGYLAPDARRARTVSQIAAACRPAGITVVDVGSRLFTPSALRAGTVDAVLGGTSATSGAGGAAPATVRGAGLRSGNGANIGGYANDRIDAIVDRLATLPDEVGAEQSDLSTEAERILWQDLPSIPLFLQPRTIAVASGISEVRANPTWAGAGWNMDRWTLHR